MSSNKLSEIEKGLYDSLLKRTDKFKSSMGDNETNLDEHIPYEWIRGRSDELYKHHMVLDLWKPRFIHIALYNYRKELSTK